MAYHTHSRPQMIDIVARKFLLAGDDPATVRAEVAQMDDGTLQVLVRGILEAAPEEARGALAEDPETIMASFPPPPAIPPAPSARPEMEFRADDFPYTPRMRGDHWLDPGDPFMPLPPTERHPAESPRIEPFMPRITQPEWDREDILRVAQRTGGAGVGGRFSAPLSAQGGPRPVPAPTPSPYSAEGGAVMSAQEENPIIRLPDTGVQWPWANQQPVRRPSPPVVPEEEAPAPAPAGRNAREAIDDVMTSLSESLGIVTMVRTQAAYDQVEAQFLRASLTLSSLDPYSAEGTTWIGFKSDMEKRLDNIRPTLIKERAPGADNGPAWAQVALAQKRFEYEQLEDERKRQREEANQLTTLRGGRLDPETGEWLETPDERTRRANQAATRTSNTGMYLDEEGNEIPTRSTFESDRAFQRQVDQDRQTLRNKMATDFASRWGDYMTLRMAGDKEAAAQEKRRLPPGAEYLPGYEPGGLASRAYANLGLPFTPRDVATYGVDLPDPYAQANEYRQMMGLIYQNEQDNPFSSFWRT